MRRPSPNSCKVETFQQWLNHANSKQGDSENRRRPLTRHGYLFTTELDFDCAFQSVLTQAGELLLVFDHVEHSGRSRLRWMASNSHLVVQMPQPMHLFGSTTMRRSSGSGRSRHFTCSSVKVATSSQWRGPSSGRRSDRRRASRARCRSCSTRDVVLVERVEVARIAVDGQRWPSCTKRWMETAPSRPVAMASMVNFGPVCSRRRRRCRARRSGRSGVSAMSTLAAASLRLGAVSRSPHSERWPIDTRTGRQRHGDGVVLVVLGRKLAVCRHAR